MACEGITIETTDLNEVIEVGVVGPQGPSGAAGVGVPTGGITGYVLAKASTADYDTEWVAQTGGGGNFSSPPPIGDVTPNTGAFTAISAGVVTADKVALDTSAGETAAEGELVWSSANKTMDIGMGHDLIQHIGQEQFYMARNETGGIINKGTPVYANGVTAGSGRITIAPMIANGTIDSKRFVGITAENITDGINGLVSNFGYIRAIDTRGTPYGETWAAGDIIYVSQSSAGGLTNVQPTSGLRLPVAIVIVRNQTAGVLLVRTEPSICASAEQGILAETAIQAGDLATVATTGDYDDLDNKPTLGNSAALDVGTTAGTVAAGDDARLSDTRDPNAHAASHAASGSDPVFDQDLNADDVVTFGAVTVSDGINDEQVNITPSGVEVRVEENYALFGPAIGLAFFGPDAELNKAEARTNLGLGDAATADSTDFAAASHTHELNALDASGITAGKILTADGDDTASWQDAPAGGDTVSIEASAADVLSVSSGAISAVDATADKIVFYDDSASELTYLELGSGLSISGTTLSATASGGSKTYAVFTALDNQPPATAFATLDTRNSIAVLDFDDATDESAVFVSIIPEGASLGSGLKIRLHWMATTATSGNVVWDVSLERMNTDLDSDSFDTIASGTAAASGTSGILTVTEITLTTIDSVTAGDGFRLKVTRDANNGSDTMTGDAELVVCEVRSAA
jgi:hypothetical protein